MKDRFQEIINILQTRVGTPLGIVTLIIDILLVIVIIFILAKLIKGKIKLSIYFTTIITLGFLFAIGYFFEIVLITKFVELLFILGVVMLIVVYNQDIRYFMEGKMEVNKVDNIFSSKQEKDDIIKIISSAVKELSDKSFGALITFEREDSLHNIILNAIQIDSKITHELITTIFTPGTACHDGAMIIRRDRIVCAGAYLPTTEKYNVPTFLGTRHRAAIGISERYDAVTIVVSEETGNISITVDGVITLDITIERLEELLDKYLLNK